MLGKYFRITSTAFSPTDIAGLQLWLKADTLVLNNNDPVASWADSSGNGRTATQVTGGLQPIYQTNQVNGLPAVTGDGADDTIATGSFTVNQAYTVFLVTKQITWTNTDRLFDTGTAFIRQNSASPGLQLTIAGGGLTTTALAVSAWGLVTSVVNGASSTLAINGGADGTGDVGAATALNKATLFSRNDGTQAANVSIAECLIYNTALSGANQSLVKTYLNTKYVLF